LRHAIQGFAVFVALVSGATVATSQPLAAEGLSPRACSSAIQASSAIEAECFTFRTYERAGDARSILLTIPVMKVRARGAVSPPDPIMLLHGGPGGAVLDRFAEYIRSIPATMAQTQLGKRWWIVFDQRGAGVSTPGLFCPDTSLAGARRCVKALRAAGIQLDAYSSRTSAGDLERLRLAFGYPTINVYGFSYGSRLAATYGRLYPSATRAIVHDAPMRPDNQESVDDALGIAAALESIADDAASVHGPDLFRRFEAGLAKLERQRRGLDAINALKFIRATTYGLTDDTELTARAMAAIAENRFADVQTMEQAWRKEEVVDPPRAPRGFAAGLNWSVDCNEEKVFESPRELRIAMRRHGSVVSTYLKSIMTDQLFEICAIWPSGRAPPSENTPADLSAPQIALTGEYDPSLSLFAGDGIKTGGRSVQNVMFRRMGHVQLIRAKMPCAMRLVEDFLDAPTVPVNAECAGK
jgi:pimeloyl-ACP methyl ester carboxylesterase